MLPAPNSVLVPPADAERAATNTRAHVERAAVVLFATAREPDRPTILQFLKRLIDLLIKGIWRATFGTRNVIQITDAQSIDLKQISAVVTESVIADLESDYVELRQSTYDNKSPVNAQAAATAFATTAYSTVMVALFDLLPVPLEAKNLFIRKTWLAKLDDKTRPLHRRLDGRTKRYTEPYWRWGPGQVLDYPGDRRAPIEAWANCRCIQVIHWARDHREVKKALGRAS